jgi:catechol 2,3-dioxygenase-like lactoylglutathione lyase family enzyme
LIPSIDRVDHIHVYVSNRESALAWYESVLGLKTDPNLLDWADNGGPLTIGDIDGALHLALFERPALPCRSVIALGVSAMEFLRWQRHLSQVLGQPIRAVDHELSWSMYFSDPDGNPFEITCYNYAVLADVLGKDTAGILTR